MIEHLIVSVWGGLTASALVAVAGVVLMCYFYVKNRKYTGDGGMLSMVKAYIVNLPRYLYQTTDWEQYARALGYAFACGFAVVFVGSLFYVGVTEVYL